jgi:predicted TIM-barrel fold metal-dependent hydrolase
MNVDRSFFDCNCMIGKRADRREGEPWSLDQLRADMQAHGIAGALVVHAWSRDYDPAAGNREIIGAIGNEPGLHPCWAILPPGSGELSAPDRFVKEMLDNQVLAAIAFPHVHNYSLSSWSMSSLLAALESRRIPLLLPYEQTTWEEVDRLCSTYLYLPVIVTDLSYRHLRNLLPLWEKHRNLFVDLSWFSIHDGLSYLFEKDLVGQVLFGTNYPRYAPGAAITMVTYANIPEGARHLVAGGTLRGIINRIRRDAR